ncbi:hypothetical protein K8Q93_00570 [Candidatus Parcubacteria bacterium]|nr:hypothetical protein [Candidatus Parcubacteria bacterium]
MNTESGPEVLLVHADSQTLGGWAWSLRELFPGIGVITAQKVVHAFNQFVWDAKHLKVAVLPRRGADGCTIEFARRIRRDKEFTGVIFTTATDPEFLKELDPRKGDRVFESEQELLTALSIALAHQRIGGTPVVQPELMSA